MATEWENGISRLHLDTRATLIITYLVVSWSVDKVYFGPVRVGLNLKKENKREWRPNPPLGRLARSQLASPLCEARLRFHPRLGFDDTKFVSLFVDSVARPGHATQFCLISAGFSLPSVERHTAQTRKSGFRCGPVRCLSGALSPRLSRPLI